MPTFGDLLCERVEQLECVDAAHVSVGRQHADADVDRAVAERDHPAVAGDRVAGSVSDAEVGLDPRLGGAVTAEVGPSGDAVGPVTLPGGAEVAPEAAVRAVGDHDESGAHHVVALGARVELGIDGQRRASDESALDDRRRRLMAHQHRRSRVGRARPQVCIEQVATQRRGVVRHVGVARPGRRDASRSVDEPNSGEAMSAERHRVDVEQRQLAQRSWGDRITAGLVARDRALLDDRDVMAGSGQPGGDRRSGRTPADDEDVGVQRVLRQPAAPGGEPGMALGPIGVSATSPIVGPASDV